MQLTADPGTSRPAALPSAQHRFAIFAWSVLIYTLAVILWGALVRATGSGAGCGGHWPLCNGDALPQMAQEATFIEFTHRIMSGIALVAVVALFAWAFRACPPRHRARRWASWSLVFICTEALLGAALVLLGHVASNESIGRIYSLSAHLINTFLLLASLALAAWSASLVEPPRVSGKFGFASFAPLAAIVIVAIAGAITALGDTLFPAHTLAEGVREDFAATAHFLVRLRVIHPALAIATAGSLVWWALREFLARRSNRLHWLAGGVVGLTAGEVLVGALNILLKAPVAMQLIHLLIADCLWITLVLFVSERARNRRLA
jgi:cytochrome c oxidase assembly protein subunit 15/protoheme IX farnesyltransferase